MATGSSQTARYTLSGMDAVVANPLYTGRTSKWQDNQMYLKNWKRRHTSVWQMLDVPTDVGDEEADQKADDLRKSWRRIVVPIAAIVVHICLGCTSSWSVFNRVIAAQFPSWNAGTAAYSYSVGVFFMGFTAAVTGRLLRRFSPRQLVTVASIVFSSGLAFISIGLAASQEWMLYVGWVIVGIGVGLAYSPPVATLMKWFPDRVGLASGFAITGFGVGAVFTGPMAIALIPVIGTAGTLGLFCGVFFVVMITSAQFLELPPEHLRSKIAAPDTTLLQALKTPQFYIMWVILLAHVFSGGALQSQLSPILQEVFGYTPIVASGLVSGAQAANTVGRFIWAALSDKITRRWTFLIFFVTQCAFLAFLSLVGQNQISGLFLAMVFVCFSMYGGGFACMPAFTADIFGANNVQEIYGGILTAWGLSGLVGPIVITSIRTANLYLLSTFPIGVYSTTFYICSGVLALGILMTQPFILKPTAEPDQESEQKLAMQCPEQVSEEMLNKLPIMFSQLQSITLLATNFSESPPRKAPGRLKVPDRPALE